MNEKEGLQHPKHWSGYYWLCVTADEYELPLAVAESQIELAQMLGKSPGTVGSLLSRGYNGKKNGRKIVRVWGREDIPEPVMNTRKEKKFI